MRTKNKIIPGMLEYVSHVQGEVVTQNIARECASTFV